MTTLELPTVRAELDRMLAAADAQESDLQGRLAGLGEIRSDAEVAHLLTDAWIAVPREVGELLALLVRSSNARTVVEFGTSFGISTVYLAAALRDLGGGTVITTELEESKAAVAAKHLRRCGLDDLVDLRVGDALQTLGDLPEQVDLLLLDGWSEGYLPVLELVEPRLRDGALVIADDTSLFPDVLAAYLAHVRSPERGYRSVDIPLGDRLELSVRTR